MALPKKRDGRFQNLTTDYRKLLTIPVSSRLDMLETEKGKSILSSVDPSDLPKLFPTYYKNDPGFAKTLQSLTGYKYSSETGADGTVSLVRGGRSGSRGGQSESGGGSTASQVPAWQKELEKRTGVSVSSIDSGPAIERLKGEIARGEGNYSSYNRGVAGDTPASAQRVDITQLTVREIMAMQDKKELFAVGKYQFIPNTLKGAVRSTGIDLDAKFDSTTQEKLFPYLISAEKRPALNAYLTGKSDNLDAALNDLSAEFASIPGANGRGRYDGDRAGNMASGGMQRVERIKQILSQARKETTEGTATTQTEVPQLPSGIAPGLIAEYEKMTPYQKQNFHKALGKLGGGDERVAIDAVNEIYKNNPSATTRELGRGGFSNDSVAERASKLSGSTQDAVARFRSFAPDAVITSTYRSPDAPEERRKVAPGAHTRGSAIDVRTNDLSTEQIQRKIAALKQAGFNYVLLEGDPPHIHAEKRDGDGFEIRQLGAGHPSISLEQAQAAASRVRYMDDTPSMVASPAPAAPPATMQDRGVMQYAGSPRAQRVSQDQPDQPQQAPGFAEGGEMKTDAKELRAVPLDKQDNMAVMDENNKVQFYMNDKEKVTYEDGKVKVSTPEQARKAEDVGPQKDGLEDKLKEIDDRLERSEQSRKEDVYQAPAMSQPEERNMKNVNRETDMLTEDLFKTPSFKRAMQNRHFVKDEDAFGDHFGFGQ